MIVKNVLSLSQKGDEDYQVRLKPNPMVALPKAVRLVGLRVRILPAAWMNVCCERCVVQVKAPLRRADPLSRGVLPNVYVLFIVIM